MLKYFLCLLMTIACYFVSFNAPGQDLIAEEISIAETPVALYSRVVNSISFPLNFDNRAQFDLIASDLSYSSKELQRKLYVLARLSMNHKIKEQDKFKHAALIIQQLESIAVTPYDFAAVTMLKGRYDGKVERNYEKSISEYNQALGQIIDQHDLRSLLLRHTIHRDLGMLYMLTLQQVPSLKHYTAYRELAYQLRDNYLITMAEADLGKFYNKNNQLTLSLQHYGEAFRRTSQTSYPTQKAHLQLRLSRVYRDLKQWDDALKHAQQAVESFEALGSEAYVSNAMTVMAMVFAEQGQWNQAIDYYLNAQQIDKKIGNITGQALNFHNLGEAHARIGDIESSLKYLLKANKIFRDRNSKHYLVNNELLIAEVAEMENLWPLVEKHASLALPIAIEKTLVEEQIKAIQFKANALKNLHKTDEAIQLLEQVITLKNGQLQPVTSKGDDPASLLTEQKLKLEINVMRERLTKAQSKKELKSTVLILLIISVMTLSLTSYYLVRRRKELSKELEELQQQSLNDPLSGHLGYRGFISKLKDPQQPKVIALFSIEQWMQADIIQGQFSCNRKQIELIDLINTQLKANCSIIRPGIFALSLPDHIEPQALIDIINTCVEKNQPNGTIALGFIALPIFGKNSIKILPELQFEALQLALHGAMSLNTNSATKQNHYVALHALDFAPSAIFSRPLYMHLEQAIQRGLLRVKANGDKTLIRWQESLS